MIPWYVVAWRWLRRLFAPRVDPPSPFESPVRRDAREVDRIIRESEREADAESELARYEARERLGREPTIDEVRSTIARIRSRRR